MDYKTIHLIVVISIIIAYLFCSNSNKVESKLNHIYFLIWMVGVDIVAVLMYIADLLTKKLT